MNICLSDLCNTVHYFSVNERIMHILTLQSVLLLFLFRLVIWMIVPSLWTCIAMFVAPDTNDKNQFFPFSFSHTSLIPPASLKATTPRWGKNEQLVLEKTNKQTWRTAGSRRKASGMKVTLFIEMRGGGGCEARLVQSSGAFVKARPPRAAASWDCAEFVFAGERNQQDLNIERRSAGSSAQEMHI